MSPERVAERRAVAERRMLLAGRALVVWRAFPEMTIAEATGFVLAGWTPECGW